MDALASTLFDRYAFTHAVLYASDFGSRPADRLGLRRPPAEIRDDAEAALAAGLDGGHFDLTAELLWTWPMLRLAWSPAATFAFQLLAGLQDDLGFLPGPGFRAAAYRSLPAGQRPGYALTTSYHSDFVMGFLCAAALRPGCAPPEQVAGHGGSGAATRELLALIDSTGGEAPSWPAALRTLTTEQQGSLGPLVLTVALRRATAAGDLDLLKAVLGSALRHQLLDGPAAEQAVALLRRSTALAGRISVQS